MMDFTIEGFFIAIVAILPGFFLAFTRSVVSNNLHDQEIEEWVATSIISSIILNAVIAIPFLLWIIGVSVDQDFEHLLKQLHSTHVALLIWYFVALYLAAFLLGVVSALRDDLNLSVLSYRWRLTPISPNANVFVHALESTFRSRQNLERRGRPDQIVPWLRIARKGTIVVGRLRRSSVRFELDKPIEVYLSPAYVVQDNQRRSIDGAHDGIHMRVLPTDVVEILSASANWLPD